MSELKDINETLKKIESKIEDKSPFSWKSFLDHDKMQEESRKKREDERNEEILEMQKTQTESIMNQEKFTGIVAFTGGILALTAIYSFIVKSTFLEKYPKNYWFITIVFLILILLCIGPLTRFIINFWKKEVFGK